MEGKYDHDLVKGHEFLYGLYSRMGGLHGLAGRVQLLLAGTQKEDFINMNKRMKEIVEGYNPRKDPENLKEIDIITLKQVQEYLIKVVVLSGEGAVSKVLREKGKPTERYVKYTVAVAYKLEDLASGTVEEREKIKKVFSDSVEAALELLNS